MRPSTLKYPFLACVLSAVPLVQAAMEGYAEPDAVVLKTGDTRSGVIVKNTAQEVWLQEKYGIAEIPKSSISRILDGVDSGMEYTEPTRAGDLPSWRVMVNDLRNNDAIQSLRQIPATTIDNGVLKNVPYLSFRVNEFAELNVYGNPDDPAGVEIGVYGRQNRDVRTLRTLRAFMVGFLGSKEEIAALYSLPLKTGGEKRIGKTSIQITPPDAPDAYGGWWILVNHPSKLEQSRLNDTEYAALTRPMAEVASRSGKLKTGWSMEHLTEALTGIQGDNATAVFLKGFFRDKSGVFRPLAGNL
jgi:hypothetical protein